MLVLLFRYKLKYYIVYINSRNPKPNQGVQVLPLVRRSPLVLQVWGRYPSWTLVELGLAHPTLLLAPNGTLKGLQRYRHQLRLGALQQLKQVALKKRNPDKNKPSLACENQNTGFSWSTADMTTSLPLVWLVLYNNIIYYKIRKTLFF